MAAEVSSLGRLARGYKEDGTDGKQELVTRDLFRADGGRGAGGGGGGGAGIVLDSPEVGWKRRLDLLSYQKIQSDSNRYLQDLNLPPLPAAPASAAGSAPAVYQSACTLEKVKSALERESRLGAANAPASPSTSCTTTINSSSSSSFKRRSPPPPPAASTEDGSDAAMMVVAGCPVCLMYVLVSTAEPACPRCGAQATLSESSRRRHQKAKRPRIDLNFSVQPADE